MRFMGPFASGSSLAHFKVVTKKFAFPLSGFGCEWEKMTGNVEIEKAILHGFSNLTNASMIKRFS